MLTSISIKILERAEYSEKYRILLDPQQTIPSGQGGGRRGAIDCHRICDGPEEKIGYRDAPNLIKNSSKDISCSNSSEL